MQTHLGRELFGPESLGADARGSTFQRARAAEGWIEPVAVAVPVALGFLAGAW
jgi:hypothetical protein